MGLVPCIAVSCALPDSPPANAAPTSAATTNVATSDTIYTCDGSSAGTITVTCNSVASEGVTAAVFGTCTPGERG